MESERGSGVVGKLELDFYYGRESEQFTFYRLPKALITDERFKGISNNAKLLYGLMLDRMSLSAQSGWYDEENRVFIKYGIKSIMEDLNLGKDSSQKLLKELEGIGLIAVEKRTGISSIIYVKNFISGDRADDSVDQAKKTPSRKSEPVENIDQSDISSSPENEPGDNFDQSENQCGGSRDLSVVPGENVAPNNNKSNNTNLINNNPISLSYQKMDEMDEATAYMELIRENIDYDLMMQNIVWKDRDMFDELYQIICDVVCVPRKTIRIAGEEYPYNLVKSKFLKLNSQHLEYVIGCMEKNTTKVANIKAYLITALYNAPNTISHYFTAEVNHDLYGLD